MKYSGILLFAALTLSALVSARQPRIFKLLQQRAQKLRNRWQLESSFTAGVDANQSPVIGLVTQTLEEEMLPDERFEGYYSYVMHSYVDFLQSAGARVIPLIMSEPEEVTLDKLSRVNGVLFPGGDGDYLEYGNFVFDKVKEYNDNGVYLPAWGVCMGYENMVSYVADAGWDAMGSYEMDFGSLELEFVVDPRDTQMFGQLGNDAFFFEDNAFTYNSHHWGVDPETFETDKGLRNMFHVTSISYLPSDGRPFVATMESNDYPFFGTQFHPEKTTQVFLEDVGINHSWLGISLSRHFNDYFVYLARHNTNNPGSYVEVQKMIVQNADTIVTDSYFGAVYVFEK